MHALCASTSRPSHFRHSVAFYCADDHRLLVGDGLPRLRSIPTIELDLGSGSLQMTPWRARSVLVSSRTSLGVYVMSPSGRIRRHRTLDQYHLEEYWECAHGACAAWTEEGPGFRTDVRWVGRGGRSLVVPDTSHILAVSSSGVVTRRTGDQTCAVTWTGVDGQSEEWPCTTGEDGGTYWPCTTTIARGGSSSEVLVRCLDRPAVRLTAPWSDGEFLMPIDISEKGGWVTWIRDVHERTEVALMWWHARLGPVGEWTTVSIPMGYQRVVPAVLTGRTPCFVGYDRASWGEVTYGVVPPELVCTPGLRRGRR